MTNIVRFSNFKKVITFLFIVSTTISITACNSENKKSLISQCQIESYSTTGENFIVSLNKTKSNIDDPDKGYRNWILICMSAKGYGFSEYKNDNECWTNTTANVQNEKCYIRHN